MKAQNPNHSAPRNSLAQLIHRRYRTILWREHVHACSVVSDSSRPHGLQPARLLCPRDSPGKNTGVGCHFLLQGIFLTQELNPHLLCLVHCQMNSLPLSRLRSPNGRKDIMAYNLSVHVNQSSLITHSDALGWRPEINSLHSLERDCQLRKDNRDIYKLQALKTKEQLTVPKLLHLKATNEPERPGRMYINCGGFNF